MAKSPPEGATTWGRFHRAEGDPVRNKTWCIYYKKSDKRCLKRFMTCPGSAYCKYYSPDEKHDGAPIIKTETKQERKPVAPFDGVKKIDISLIKVSPEALLSSNNSHVRYFEGVYKKTGVIEPPLTVSCKGSYYYLEDGNSRFFAAQKLGFTQIPVVIGTREENDFKKKLKVGTKIRYGSSGEGLIIERTDTTITVKFSNCESTYDIKLAMKSNMLKIL